MNVASRGTAMSQEIERLVHTASELSSNAGAATPSERAARAATALHGLQAREADLEFACLQLQGALIRGGKTDASARPQITQANLGH